MGYRAKEALPIIEIIPHSGRYDYESKYTKGAADHIVPAKLSPALTEQLQELAIKTFTAAGCNGVARIDMMLSEEDKPYVLEVNSVPGMTETSLVRMQLAPKGFLSPIYARKYS